MLKQKQNSGGTSAVGILKDNISTPLKRKFFRNEDGVGNINKKRKDYKKREILTSKMSPYNTILGDSKGKLVELMIEDLKAKNNIEIQILFKKRN